MDCLHLSSDRRLGSPRLHLCLSYQGQQGCCLSGGAVRAADESDFQLLSFTAVQALLERQRRFRGTPTLPSERARRLRSRGQHPWTASKPRRQADQRGGGDLLHGHGHGHAWNRGRGPWKALSEQPHFTAQQCMDLGRAAVCGRPTFCHLWRRDCLGWV